MPSPGQPSSFSYTAPNAVLHSPVQSSTLPTTATSAVLHTPVQLLVLPTPSSAIAPPQPPLPSEASLEPFTPPYSPYIHPISSCTICTTTSADIHTPVPPPPSSATTLHHPPLLSEATTEPYTLPHPPPSTSPTPSPSLSTPEPAAPSTADTALPHCRPAPAPHQPRKRHPHHCCPPKQRASHPPPASLTQLRIGNINIGGLRSSEIYVVNTLVPLYDVLVVAETKVNDRDYLMRLSHMHGWSCIQCARPRTMNAKGRPNVAYGGVAVIVFSPALVAIRSLHEDPAGLLSVELSPRTRPGQPAPQWAPINLLAAYIPPIDSPHFAPAEATLPVALHLIKRAISVYGTRNILLAGDFNFRLGTTNPDDSPRFTEDCGTANRGKRKGSVLIPVLSELNFTPLMGRTPECPAIITSRPIILNGQTPGPGVGSEVDYIFAHSVQGPLYSVLPSPPWSTNLHSDTHRPIGVSVTLQLQGEATAPPAPPPPLRYQLHDYGNPAWHNVGEATLRHLDANLNAIRNAPADEAVRLWMASLDAALGETCAHKARPLPSPELLPHEKARRRCQLASLRNRNLPPAVVKAIHEAKAAPDDNIPLKAHLCKVANRALKDHHRKVRQEEASEYDKTRKSSSHRFFTKLKGDLAPDLPTSFTGTHAPPIPHEKGCPAPLERFTEMFTKLYDGKGPVPPAATDEEWLKFVHAVERAPEMQMERPFTAQEILPLIFPMYDYSTYACPATGQHEPQCSLCCTLKAQASHWKGMDDIHNMPPTHKPRGKAQSALNGPHLIAFLSWAHDPHYSKHAYRMKISDGIATVLNKILEEEEMPAGTTNYRSIPLRKPPPKGSIPNWADPSSLYRFLSMSPLLTKILCLAIDARTIHFVTKDKLVNLSFQGASIPFMNTEWHAQALLETIKAEWAANREVYALFIDFKKAYDSVNGAVLTATLKRLGFPPKLLNLLAHWNSTRTSTLHVNGEASAPIPTQCGIGQGDVFSCILYTIFINSLHAFLKSKCPGVTPYPNTQIIAQGFVDDVAALANNLQDAQTTARAVQEWGTKFGHELQTAKNKSAILYLPVPRAQWGTMATPIERFYQLVNSLPVSEDIPALHPPTLSDGRIVPFTQEYKYLGYWLRPGLPEDAHLQQSIAYMHRNHARYFAYNGITRRICPTGVCQILKTTCLPNYLASIINPTSANITALGAAIHPLMRTLLSNLPKSTPLTFLYTESNIPSARYLITRAILTTLLSLSISKYLEAPMVALYHAQRAALSPQRVGPRPPPTAWLVRAINYLNPFVATLGDYMDIATILRLPAGRVITPSDATMAASVYARRLCDAVARSELNHLVLSHTVTQPATLFSHATAPGPPRQVQLDLQFGLKYTAAGAAFPSKCTPLSCGINMGTSLTARVTTRIHPSKLLALRSARLGACSLSYAPLAPPSWITKGERSREHFRTLARGVQCPLCGTAVADPRHILCECTHPAVAAARAVALDRATIYLPTLASKIYHANPHPNAELKDTYRDLLALPPRPDWATPSGKTLIHRLVLALPWPEACVDDPVAAHARLLGRLMDLTTVRNSRLHPIANSWVQWGSKTLLRTCGVWAAAVESAEPPA